MAVDTRTHRLTICHGEDMKEVFEVIKEISKDKNIIGKLSHALLKQALFYFLDEINCDFSIIDRDVKHLVMRVDCGIMDRQFAQAVTKNKLKGGQHEIE